MLTLLGLPNVCPCVCVCVCVHISFAAGAGVGFCLKSSDCLHLSAQVFDTQWPFGIQLEVRVAQILHLEFVEGHADSEQCEFKIPLPPVSGETLLKCEGGRAGAHWYDASGIIE